MFENACFFTLPVLVLLGGAFVVIFFTFGQANFQFDLAMFPVQGQRDEGIALAINRTYQSVYFQSMQ